MQSKERWEEKMSNLTAFEYGMRAFKEGKMCVPALDQEFLETHIKGLMVGEGASEILTEWTKGWAKANLDVPIKIENELIK
jgi:hypothetical protein